MRLLPYISGQAELLDRHLQRTNEVFATHTHTHEKCVDKPSLTAATVVLMMIEMQLEPELPILP